MFPRAELHRSTRWWPCAANNHENKPALCPLSRSKFQMFKLNLGLSTRRRLLVFFAMPLAIYSQSTESNSQTELIRALRERIDQLERRMAQMEDAFAAGTTCARLKPETKPDTVT